MTLRGGRVNQRRGKSFEKQCVDRVQKLGLSLLVKQVKRPNPYISWWDLDFPEIGLKADCKFTFNEFTKKEKNRLYKNVVSLYGNKTVVIIGERRAKTRLSFENDVRVLVKNKIGLVEIYYDDWLCYLERKLICQRKPLQNRKRNKK